MGWETGNAEGKTGFLWFTEKRNKAILHTFREGYCCNKGNAKFYVVLYYCEK